MDLTTRYMGLVLNNPLVASASPLTGELSNIRRLEDAGIGAIVLPSVFEEEINAEAARFSALTMAGENSWPEASTPFTTLDNYQHGPQHYLELVHRAAAAVEVPVIASLNGASNAGWIAYAKLLEEAGAAALELNIYFLPTDLTLNGAAVEQRYLDILRTVRAAVRVPIAVKLNPYFSAIGHMALALQEAGADGLVLFNRFYQPDFDLSRLQVRTNLQLSQPNEIRLPLLWLAVLAGRINCSLAASSGVDTADEVIKYLLAGADVVMTTSALLRHDISHVATLRQGLETWLQAREFSSLNAMRGVMSQRGLRNPLAFERANYIKILQGYEEG